MKTGRRAKKTPISQAADPLARISEVKAKYEADLLDKANVVAVGIGLPMRNGRPAGPLGIVVSVTHKVSPQELDEDDLVPQALEEVPVWVEAIDHPRAVDASDGAQPSEDDCQDSGVTA
jgi:hypothetical protein